MAGEGGFTERDGEVTPEEVAAALNGSAHLRRVWFKKNVAGGKTLRYPPGQTNCGTDEKPVLRDNEELAKEILDYGKINSTYTFVNIVQPGESSKYEWEIDDDQNPDKPFIVGE